MFTIKDLKDNTINLDGLKEYSNDFEVLCLNERGKRIPFYIDFVSSEYISVSTFGVNLINISIDVEYVLNEEYIILRNIYGTRIRITILPNPYFVDDREYKFKITKTEVKDSKSIKIRIFSKVNKSEIGWKCIYDGKPLSYTIAPRENSKSGYVNITLNDNVLVEYDSHIMFMQDESGEQIDLKIKNSPNGVEIIEG